MINPIFDCFSTNYKKPFGAVEQETECVFSIRVPNKINVTECALVMFRPGVKEKFVMLEKSGAFEDCTVYSGVYTPQDTGLHHYYFFVSSGGTRSYIKRSGASIGSFDGTELFQLTVYEKGMTTPDWLKGGVMYQIFPDRFAKSAESDIIPPLGRKMHINWYDLPNWRPDERGTITNDDYFGGNLKGIQEKLPYLKKLGVTAVYLNPIFESHENHRYSTANYEHIDPLLGTEQDFVRLCAEAKRFGIGIILDGVFSHTGADSIYFNKFGRYGEKTGAFRDSESPYREWYSFINYPETYESWWGITTLPNVNENNPSYKDYICGEGGILQKWLDLGASGWRLDVADELPDEFLDELHTSVKAKGGEKVIYGEVWEDASNKESYGVRRRYLTGKQLDSVMNYPFKECILNYIKYSEPKPFTDGIMTIVEHYPKPCVDILMNFLSTHDTERAITRLAGEDIGMHDREWQSKRSLSPQEYAYGSALMRCATALQFFLPGIPCVYYADEAGLEGCKDPFNRRTYPWNKEDLNLVDFVAELGSMRTRSRVFEKGELEFVDVTSDYCVFRRIDRELGLSAVIYLNKSTHGMAFSLSDTLGECQCFHVARQEKRERGKIVVSPFDYEVVFVKF